MDGKAVTQRQGTARWLLDSDEYGDGRHEQNGDEPQASATAMDGDGWWDEDSTLMDSGVQRQ